MKHLRGKDMEKKKKKEKRKGRNSFSEHHCTMMPSSFNPAGSPAGLVQPARSKRISLDRALRKRVKWPRSITMTSSRWESVCI